MNSFSHFKNARIKGIIKGYFYGLIVIALVYLLFTPALASLILPDHSELILQPNQHSNSKLDLFVNLLRSILIIFGMLGLFRVCLILKYQCRKYQILANYLDSLNQEKIAGNYADFIQDLDDAVTSIESGQNKKYGHIAENIKYFLDGSLDQKIIDSYQYYILSLALLITLGAIFSIKAIDQLVHFQIYKLFGFLL